MSETVYVVLRVHERVLMAGRSIVVGGGGMVACCQFWETVFRVYDALCYGCRCIDDEILCLRSWNSYELKTDSDCGVM